MGTPSTTSAPSATSTVTAERAVDRVVLSSCASIAGSATSLIATHSMSASRSNAARNAARPVRPKPLMATRTDMAFSLRSISMPRLGRWRPLAISGIQPMGCGKSTRAVRARADSTLSCREEVINGTLWIEPSSVNVEVHDGEVLLSGQVETQTDAEVMPTLVQRVPGVVSVRSKLCWRYQNGRLDKPAA